MEKAAAREVFTKPVGLFLTQVHLSRFDYIKVGEIKQLGIHDLHRMRRLAKKSRSFEVIVLDPPTFSQSKERGVFRVEKNYGELVAAALPLLKPEGVLLASTNAADWPPEKFLAAVEGAVRVAKRKILKQHYAPQPPDFPVSRAEPAYLKTLWARVG